MQFNLSFSIQVHSLLFIFEFKRLYIIEFMTLTLTRCEMAENIKCFLLTAIYCFVIKYSHVLPKLQISQTIILYFLRKSKRQANNK